MHHAIINLHFILYAAQDATGNADEGEGKAWFAFLERFLGHWEQLLAVQALMAVILSADYFTPNLLPAEMQGQTRIRSIID